MECDTCGRAHDAQRLPFLCAVDARNRLYEPRFAGSLAMIERDELQKKANEALSDPNRLESLRSEQQLAVDRTRHIIAQADRLRDDVEAAKREIATKKEAIDRRKSDLATASSGVGARRSRQLKDTERSISVLKYKWRRNAETMAANRAYLCMEAARLYGLRRIKKANSTRYEIGHAEIIELLGMNNASPEAISTSLANVAHILVLASHYLAIRLPAEITLPHRDYPRPTIFSLASSYQYVDVPFPGTNNLQLQAPSRDGEARHTPRPRPLYVNKTLPTLAKEDPSTYSSFVEGVTLLAYDIAWACCSQGIAFGDRDEDLCNMGQNLYRLLIGNQLYSNPAAQIFAAPLPADEGGSSEAASDKEVIEAGKAKNLMGWYSHGSAHAFLGSAEGAEFVRSFKLPNPIKIADRLRKRLISEAPMLEWETIETEDAQSEEDGEGDGVLIKGHKRRDSLRRLFGVDSVMTAGSPDKGVGGVAGPASPAGGTTRTARDGSEGERPRQQLGANGWTKLKPR